MRLPAKKADISRRSACRTIVGGSHAAAAKSGESANRSGRHAVTQVLDTRSALIPASWGGMTTHYDDSMILMIIDLFWSDESCDLAATLHGLGGEFRMSEVEQMDAAIARHGSAVPSHLDLMGGDAGDRAQSGGLVVVLADPDDAVGQNKPASHGGIHVGPP